MFFGRHPLVTFVLVCALCLSGFMRAAHCLAAFLSLCRSFFDFEVPSRYSLVSLCGDRDDWPADGTAGAARGEETCATITAHSSTHSSGAMRRAALA